MNKVKLYPSAKNIRFNRRNYELLQKYQDVCSNIGVGIATIPNFTRTLRYVRLFFLRFEYRELILEKMIYADLR